MTADIPSFQSSHTSYCVTQSQSEIVRREMNALVLLASRRNTVSRLLDLM